MGLKKLDLSGNDLEIPTPGEASRFFANCVGGLECKGLPPDSCSAFGESARESAHTPGLCIRCTSSQFISGIVFLVLLVVAVAGFWVYVELVGRFPFFTSWIATSSIILYHTQTLGLLGELMAVESTSAAKAARAAFAAISSFSFARPECMFDSGVPIIYVSTGVAVGLPLLLFLLLKLMKCYHKSCLSYNFGEVAGHPDEARDNDVDSLEDAFVILFCLQLASVCRLCFLGLSLGKSMGPPVILVALAILIVEAAICARLFVHVRALQGKHGCRGFAPEAITDALVVLGIRASRVGVTGLSQERLSWRLRYLVAKYDRHAPGWQFAIWARQLALAAISVGFRSRVEESDSPYEQVYVYVQAAFALVVVVAGLWWHVRVQPYVYQYQNRLEAGLACTCILFITFGCIFHGMKCGNKHCKVLDACLYMVLLSPIAFAIGVKLVDWNARRRQARRPWDRRPCSPMDSHGAGVLVSTGTAVLLEN